jgi:hypothetical protein
MLSREEIAQEFLLRESVQKAISLIHNRNTIKRKSEILEQIKLRSIIQDLIIEAAVDPDEDPADSTGINVLADLIKNSNFLKTIRTGYKILTTSPDQRASYRAHIINAIQDALAPVMANKLAEESNPEMNVEEDVEVNISDEDKFIEGEPEFEIDQKEQEVEEEDPESKFAIDGEDETGRDRAFKDFGDIEQTIINHFEMLSDETDREKFYDYLIANTKLYFDRYERQLQSNVAEPTNQEYEDAAAAQAPESVVDSGSEEEAGLGADEEEPDLGATLGS